MSSAEEYGGRRPAVAPDQVAGMGEPPDDVAPERRPVPEGDRPEIEEYEPVDPDPEAVIDEAAGGPDVDDADDAYPHEGPEAPEEGLA